MVGLGVKSLLRRRRRLSDANLVNSCRIVGGVTGTRGEDRKISRCGGSRKTGSSSG